MESTLWKREGLRRGRRRMSKPAGPLPHHGRQPGSGSPEIGLDRLERHCASHAKGLSAVRGTGQSGSPPAWDFRIRAPCGGPSTTCLRRPSLEELDRLWEQVRPFYLSLHAYVRQRLRAHYGPEVVPAGGPIPAHLLGNMWAQTWSNVLPAGGAAGNRSGLRSHRDSSVSKDHPQADGLPTGRGFSVRSVSPLCRRASGIAPCSKNPATGRSSAMPAPGTSTGREDLRIKMCIDITAEDFNVIHHELGHNYYQRAYSQQPVLFRESANDGFHEAVGDTIALSITPAYLTRLGLLKQAPAVLQGPGAAVAPGAGQDRLPSLRPAGGSVAAGRCSPGEIPPDRYNQAWWELRGKYQGIAASGGPRRRRFRPGRQVPRAGQRAPILATFWPRSCSINSIGPWPGKPPARNRSIDAPSTGASLPESACAPCSPWGPAGPGRRRWRC